MTLEEAKEFYFRYSGHSFHMGREEPEKYRAFRQLSLSEETLKEWDEELLEDLFAGMWTDPQRVWIVHESILSILRRERCDTKRYGERLFKEMEKMDRLDQFQRVLILENMAGRNAAMNDGGVFLFRKEPGSATKMDAVCEHLIASCGPLTDDRAREAVRRYRIAYLKWGPVSVKEKERS
ncbi:MAG: hypothetical protein IKE21_04175 [Erysipelotrichaceae bacterium]|nr:hypothetical protein [Erysipelotrichaceae bacterium]